jgi:hypothetical protein
MWSSGMICSPLGWYKRSLNVKGIQHVPRKHWYLLPVYVVSLPRRKLYESSDLIVTSYTSQELYTVINIGHNTHQYQQSGCVIFPASSFVVLRYLRPYAIFFCLSYVYFSPFSLYLFVSVICLVRLSVLPSACPSFRLLVYLSHLSCLPVCLSACLQHSVTHLTWECIRLNDLVWTATTLRSIELRARRDLSLHRHRNVTANWKISLYEKVAPILHVILKLSEL